MCAAAELSGIARFAGTVKGKKLCLSTENRNAAERIVKDMSEGFGINAEYSGEKTYRIQIEKQYEIENLAEILFPELEGGMIEEIMPFECCRASYVRGAFLGGGSVNDPQKGYHMEFVTKYEKEAKLLREVLGEAGFSSKITSRKGNYIVYIKECETIADILGYLGAGKSALDFYNIQIEKDMRNKVNRRVNCETANVEKVAKAAYRQIKAIEKIKKERGLDRLPDSLSEIAKLRLEFPEDSLKELGERLSPSIGKSGVNHRLNRIIELAEEI